LEVNNIISRIYRHFKCQNVKYRCNKNGQKENLLSRHGHVSPEEKSDIELEISWQEFKYIRENVGIMKEYLSKLV
jgi:hypothetical protein